MNNLQLEQSVDIQRNVEVLMRDGIILRADIYKPTFSNKYPGILVRTPYGKSGHNPERFAQAGFVVMVQDSRGRYSSEGQWIPFTEKDTGDAEDGYDTVEWLASQPYCNGNIGTMGSSYNGWMQWETARLQPPHLKAMCASSIPLELSEIDWPGGFKPARRIFWWLASMAPNIRRRNNLPPPHTTEDARRLWHSQYGERWLWFLPWADIPQYLPHGLAEYVDAWLKRPSEAIWGFQDIHQNVEVPNLDFSGWYDHCSGTTAHLGLMQQNAATKVARTGSRLMLGPWNHAEIGKRKIGGIDFGEEAFIDTDAVKIRWFEHWLKGKDNGIQFEPAVKYFVMGTGKWRTSTTWPPTNKKEITLFLTHCFGSGKLSLTKPVTSGSDSYNYDPKDPAPTLWSRSLFTEPSDRRKLEHRSDILYYRTEPLSQDLEIVGYPQVTLYVSSTAKDTDFFVHLVDENPTGIALDVSYGMIRMRHRNGLDRSDLLIPGDIVQVKLSLGPTACRFIAGHSIRLEITSSNFPNHDRNHNTGMDDMMDTILIKAHQTVHHSPSMHSAVHLPLIDPK